MDTEHRFIAALVLTKIALLLPCPLPLLGVTTSVMATMMELSGTAWTATHPAVPPPWFSVTLPTCTSDDIEVRICSDQTFGMGRRTEATYLHVLEIYVQ